MCVWALDKGDVPVPADVWHGHPAAQCHDADALARLEREVFGFLIGDSAGGELRRRVQALERLVPPLRTGRTPGGFLPRMILCLRPERLVGGGGVADGGRGEL